MASFFISFCEMAVPPPTFIRKRGLRRAASLTFIAPSDNGVQQSHHRFQSNVCLGSVRAYRHPSHASPLSAPLVDTVRADPKWRAAKNGIALVLLYVREGRYQMAFQLK